MLLGTAFNTNTGELIVDNRPGGGYLYETAIRTCTHCQANIHLHKKDSPYGYCRKCDAPICAHCATKALTEGCTPFKALVDQILEARERARQNARAYGLDAA